MFEASFAARAAAPAPRGSGSSESTSSTASLPRKERPASKARRSAGGSTVSPSFLRSRVGGKSFWSALTESGPQHRDAFVVTERREPSSGGKAHLPVEILESFEKERGLCIHEFYRHPAARSCPVARDHSRSRLRWFPSSPMRSSVPAATIRSTAVPVSIHLVQFGDGVSLGGLLTFLRSAASDLAYRLHPGGPHPLQSLKAHPLAHPVPDADALASKGTCMTPLRTSRPLSFKARRSGAIAASDSRSASSMTASSRVALLSLPSAERSNSGSDWRTHRDHATCQASRTEPAADSRSRIVTADSVQKVRASTLARHLPDWSRRVHQKQFRAAARGSVHPHPSSPAPRIHGGRPSADRNRACYDCSGPGSWTRQPGVQELGVQRHHRAAPG